MRFASWLVSRDGTPAWTTDPHDRDIALMPKAEAYALNRTIRAAGLEAYPTEGVQAVTLVNDDGRRVEEAIRTRAERDRQGQVVAVFVLLVLGTVVVLSALVARLAAA